MKKPLKVAASLLFVAAGVCSLLGAIPNQIPQHQQQNTNSSALAYEFETASIKPNKSGFVTFRSGFTADGFRSEDTTVRWLIQQAYGVSDFFLSGVPNWLNTEHFDVEAKMDTSVADRLSKLTPAELKLARQQMFQSLLAERFNLKVHRETKNATVYFLTIGKNGPKLQDAKTGNTLAVNADGTPARSRIQVGIAKGGAEEIQAYSTDMKTLGDFLTRALDRPVLDKTALTGAYDFTLEWMPDIASTPAPDSPNAVPLPGIPGASLFTALQQQLGLKLEPGKSPIEIIVIDHVERPSGNQHLTSTSHLARPLAITPLFPIDCNVSIPISAIPQKIPCPHPNQLSVANKGLTAISCTSVANTGLRCCLCRRGVGVVVVDGARVAAASRHSNTCCSRAGLDWKVLAPVELPFRIAAVDRGFWSSSSASLRSYFLSFSSPQKLHYNAVSSENARFVCIIMQFLTL